MSVREDGRHHCDGCGLDLGRGGVAVCVVISDLDPARRGLVRNLHLCRDREEGEGPARRKVEGCSRRLDNPDVLADYYENVETQTS